MNPFSAVLNALGWSVSPTHEDHFWVWLLLNYGAAEYTAHSESSTYSDPFREVLHRFSAYPGPAYTKLAQILNARIK